MQGLNPFARGQGDRGRPAPVRHAPLRPEPTPQRAARRDGAPEHRGGAARGRGGEDPAAHRSTSSA